MSLKQAESQRGVRPSWGVALIWGLVCALILIANASKGFIPYVQGWGQVYWWLDYRDGMIRRGLAGQLFQWVFGTLSPQGLTGPVLTLHLLCVGLIGVVMAGLSVQVMARLRGGDRLVFATIALWLFVSQLWPSLTYDVGYLDPVVLVMALLAALAWRRRWIVLAAVLMAAGPMVHEYFLFLVPFVLAAGADETPAPAWSDDELLPLDAEIKHPDPAWRPALLGGLAVASTLVVTSFSKAPAALAQLADMPIDTAQKQALMSTTLGQSMGQAVDGMARLFVAEAAFAAGSFAYFLLPAIVASLALMFWKAPGRTPAPLLKVAAGLFPITALLVAWDLSRLLVITTFTAGTLFLLAAEQRTRADEL